jgi:outer membrane protein OmpA-like peptidoglycan-associated protein
MQLLLQRKPEHPVVQRAPVQHAPEPTASAAGMPRFLREATPDAGLTDAGTAPTDAGDALPGGIAEPANAGAGPDACATVEEEERKARFRNRTFSALDFRPSAGYGKFDAYYWPRQSLMAAVVKMKFNYVQADNTPPPATLMSMWLSGQDITRFFWTEAQKRQFAEDYRQRVADRWSFAHTFRSTKPCWPFTASPYVAPRVVDDAANAHFEVTVHKSAGPGIDYKSGFRAENPGTPGWRGTGDLYSSDVREEPNFNSVQVARSERQRLERAIAAASASPVLFARDSAVIEPTYAARLNILATAMKAKNPSDPGIPVVFRGFASAEGQHAHNERLSEDRAQAVAEELRRAGVPQPLVISAMGPTGTPNDAANRKVEIVPSTTFETSYAGNRYSVAEHEFGHTLGLPDEYVNRTSGALGAKQTAFANLARAAGVAPPDRWGDTTASQMSAGVDVLPRHYLTLWEALGQMTAPDISRNEWSID